MEDRVSAKSSNVCVHAIPDGFRFHLTIDVLGNPHGILHEWKKEEILELLVWSFWVSCGICTSYRFVDKPRATSPRGIKRSSVVMVVLL